jgi:hypothetical protein
MEAAVMRAASPSMSQMATRAPDAEKRSAIAQPMPRAAPVTIATLPSRSMRFKRASICCPQPVCPARR